ncbi:phosphate signaling complex protein PhoU [Sporanaerobacter acetigenes]|uniref:Phosphate-specific transport system accessory protein PhoU n=1 Tax=Sporanaerobacter acetigenes DSM 13106 TaxID=1123281 RepID=A0A1M5YK55_9FIRM|nr:phosphate signaling complex protein PhoU [Sporanaerobacter acetigenes]SHI12352.1 phosphate transport system protein [Sporanaerobacter acetigenes DSM 13106]
MRDRFNRELEILNNELIEMGSAVEKAIQDAIIALREKDMILAQKIVDNDDEIDNMEKDIESRCLKLLVQQQPVAGNLRLISSIFKMITDLERIGDQVQDISEIILRIGNNKLIKELTHIPQMAEATMKMVNKSIDAFVSKDLELAKEVIEYDDIVDNLFATIKDELISLIRMDASNGEQAIDLLMIAKYLERIGDHAENIAEWVVFSITGMHKSEEKM